MSSTIDNKLIYVFCHDIGLLCQICPKNKEGTWYVENDITLRCDSPTCCDELHKQLLKMTVRQNEALYWFFNQDNEIVLVHLCFSATKIVR
jgi:hypothetical protein